MAVAEPKQPFYAANDLILLRFWWNWNNQILNTAYSKMFDGHANCCVSHAGLKTWAHDDVEQILIAEMFGE
ncbi:hypothetical protein WK66_15530 [Burkholderia ubonensis]|nr:hypothetical protein WK66_15530 [Burkholderia ubonensis]